MFGSIKASWKKSKSMVLIESIFKQNCTFIDDDINPVEDSRRLTNLAWSENPDLFNGKLGFQPHETAFAAYALVQGVLYYEDLGFNPKFLFRCACNLFADIETNAQSYSLSNLDMRLIGNAMESLEPMLQETSNLAERL